MVFTEKTLNEKEIFNGKIIRVHVDDVELDLVVTVNDGGSWYILQARESTASSYPIFGISGSSTGNTILFGWGGSQSLIRSDIVRTNGHKYHVNAKAKNGTATLSVEDP